MDSYWQDQFRCVTEKAALACVSFIGKKDNEAADEAAVSAMRKSLNEINFKGRIVIGEGERDKAPMLYIGEVLGCGLEEMDIAVDPLEGTNLCAYNEKGALSVIAVAKKGNLLYAPDIYMDKLACCEKGKGHLSLDYPPSKNIEILAQLLNKPISEITVIVLDRDRHKGLINEVRLSGAKLQLISDGDVSAGIQTCLDHLPADLLLGIGGAPEGVLTAAALKCLKGEFQGRLIYKNENEKKRSFEMGITDLDQCFQRDDLVRGDVVFSATGVTEGDLVKGVKYDDNKYSLNSLVLTTNPPYIQYKTVIL